jgi:beta-xylosidase
MPTRREALGSLAAGGAALAVPGSASPVRNSCAVKAEPHWARGLEGQRKADLGNGRFLNPILAGDHPDPSIVRDGADYYMTFSSFDSYPGLVIWHSRDLVNWQPLNAALATPIGSVWAPDLCRHGGRWFIYIPTRGKKRSIWVIAADDIRGPWSEPVDLDLPDHIDPNHVVGENGRRYLALSNGDLVALSDDGLSRTGAPRHIYDPWHYPEDWVVESFSPEGPKILRRGGWFFMLTAVGGTAGPPTGHMVIAARSRSLFGPWENAPNNPVVRTISPAERWWSRGHASAIEGPDGSWWLFYHGYENGLRTLGRQTLLAPMTWTADGWIRAGGGDLSHPLAKPNGGEALAHGMALADDFSSNRLGTLWSFYDPGPDEQSRFRTERGVLHLTAKGTHPADCSPLCLPAGDPAYEVETEIEISGGASAGLILFYNRRLYAGLGFDDSGFVMHRYGLERPQAKPEGIADRLFLRLRNDRNILTIHHSADGKAWTKFGVQMDVSGYHHNTAGDFLSLRPAIYVAGTGKARFNGVRYRAL